jgi:hypothetical protein
MQKSGEKYYNPQLISEKQHFNWALGMELENLPRPTSFYFVTNSCEVVQNNKPYCLCSPKQVLLLTIDISFVGVSLD